jgi:hypothetical protein
VRLPRNAVAFPLTGTKAEELARVTLEHFVPVRYRGAGHMILTDLVCSRERKALALVAKGAIRLRLGCGGEYKAGWVNIDLLAGAYDAVASISALHHMDLPAVLPRLAAALRPGGLLIAVSLHRVEIPRGLPAEAVSVLRRQRPARRPAVPARRAA